MSEDKKYIFGIPVADKDYLTSFGVIEKIRDDLTGDIVAMMGLSEFSLRSNLRRANNENADIVLIFDKEHFGDAIIIKDMKKHIQISVDKDKVLDKVKELLGITYPKEILMAYKSGEFNLDYAELLLKMYYEKGYK